MKIILFLIFLFIVGCSRYESQSSTKLVISNAVVFGDDEALLYGISEEGEKFSEKLSPGEEKIIQIKNW